MRGVRQIPSLIITAAYAAGTGCGGGGTCSVTSPEDYDGVSAECATISVTQWPEDELVLVSKSEDTALWLEASDDLVIVDGHQTVVPRDLAFRTIDLRGFASVAGRVEVSERVVVADYLENWLDVGAPPDVELAPRIPAAEECATEIEPGIDAEFWAIVGVSAGRHVRLHAEGEHPCLSVAFGGEPGAPASWEGFSIAVDDGVKPRRLLRIDAAEGLVLSMLTPFGADARHIEVNLTDDVVLAEAGSTLLEEYAGWLVQQGFTGDLKRCTYVDSRWDCALWQGPAMGGM